MGLFSKFRQSAAKSKLIKEAAALAQSGRVPEAVNAIYDYLEKDEVFISILTTFDATKDDIENIIAGIMMAGYGAEFGGHFVPVSAVLFHDTLAYCLRAECGQVSKPDAYFEVHEYFRSGSLVFEPEQAFH